MTGKNAGMGFAGGLPVAYPRRGGWFDQRWKGSGEALRRLPAVCSSLAYVVKKSEPGPVGSDGDCDCGLAFAVSKTTTCVLELMLTRNGLFQLPPSAGASFAGLSQVWTPVVSYGLLSRKRYQPWPAR